jgi:citronellyl-CoA dehydrogenase
MKVRGFMYQMLQFQEERLWGAANISRPRVLRRRARSSTARSAKTFGRPVIDTRWCTSRLAELQTEIELLRSLVYQRHWSSTSRVRKDVTQLASMAKLKAGRLTREVAMQVPAVLGWHGLHLGEPGVALYRDGRLASIGGGADEIMLGIIAKLMGTLPGLSESQT